MEVVEILKLIFEVPDVFRESSEASGGETLVSRFDVEGEKGVRFEEEAVA